MSETRDYICEVCDQPIQPDDLCSSDIEVGTCHAACLEGCVVVDLETNAPVDRPVATFRFGDVYDG